jgi:3-isopropylmalate/(R)-2-methylmalate dehydratase small subunit
VTRTGFEDGLFAAWRDDPTFVLNDPAYAGGTVLVVGSQFGTGSSREHAVWALQNYGFKAVVAPSFGPIFRNNALKGGLLPVELPLAAVESLWDMAERPGGVEVTVDVAAREARVPGATWAFPLDEHSRYRLLEGLDDIGLTLRQAGAIAEFEALRPSWKPVVA